MEEYKICSCCGGRLPIDCFGFKNKSQSNKRRADCKKCHNETVKRGYRNKKNWIDAQKMACEKCEESRPYLLDFHHLDPGEKEGKFMQLVYVLNKDGLPLMPTHKLGKVRHLLNEGKVKIVKRNPFTIQLNYESSNYVQDATLGANYAKKKQEYYALMKKSADLKHKVDLLNKASTDNATYTNKLLNEEEIKCSTGKSDITDFVPSALMVGLAEADITTEIAELKAELLSINQTIEKVKLELSELQNNIYSVK